MEYKNITKVPLRFFHDPKDDWQANYNNQDFFQYNVERLRWQFVDSDYYDENPFGGCVDMKTLEVKDPVKFYRLALSTHGDLLKLVKDIDWDWLGDDFVHMTDYLSWIMEHDPEFVYATKIVDGDDCMEIATWKIPKEFMQGKLREAYISGASEVENLLT